MLRKKADNVILSLEGCKNSEPGRGPLLTSNNSYSYFKRKYPVLVPNIFPCTIHSFITSTNPSFLLSKYRPRMLPNLIPNSSNSSFCTGSQKTHSLRCVTPVCSPIPVFLPVSSPRNLKLLIMPWSVRFHSRERSELLCKFVHPFPIFLST